MKLTRVVTMTGLALGLVAGTAFAAGHDGPPPAVKARLGLMANLAYNLGVLGEMAKGNTDYNADVAAVAAANLAAFSATDQSLLWTAGTDTGSISGTRALPKIWEAMADFDSKSADLAKASMTFAAAAGADLAGLQGAIGGVGAACGACHKAYREPQ